MGFRFKNSSCVVIGTFNIYIIQPKLLFEMGLIEKDCKVKLQSDFSQPGIRFETNHLTWHVRPERVSVETTDPKIDCGQPLVKLLDNLLWTPTMAVGVNTVFYGDSETEKFLPSNFRLPTVSGFEPAQRTCHVSTHRDGRTLNLQLAHNQETEGPAGIELNLNVHTALTIKGQTKTQREVNELAQSACQSFLQQRENVVVFASTLLQCEDFTYDIINNVE